jgi:hypothetical protein
VIEIVMNDARVDIGSAPDGAKQMRAIDPNSGITVVLTWPKEGAEIIGNALLGQSGLVIAKQVPKVA